MLRFLLLLSVLFIWHPAFAQVPQDFSVPLSATTTSDPPAIELHWPSADNATGYIVSRRENPDLPFVQITIDGTDTGYVDRNVVAGKLYEYAVTKFTDIDNTSNTGYGLIATGIGLSTPERRGVVLLLVDDSISGYLNPELDRLTMDLYADGWGVKRFAVPRSAAVPEVKKIIRDAYQADLANVNSVLLLGHIPVPYSGDIAPDDHTPGFGNHQGAWAADVYYADMTGGWSDTRVNDVTADRDANKNKPGDGKFDQNELPGKAALQLGRIDLYEMYAFSKDEAALLKQYLDKDHRYRMGELTAPRRALVSDSFFVLGANDVPATNGWRNFAVLVGNDSVSEHPYTDLQTTPYLWSYGCGGGIYFAGAGIGTVWDFASKNYQGIFTMIFGSFFGDWDEGDNLLRAPLADEYGLTSAWAGRPYWYLHHMAMGSTIGYSTMLTQNYKYYPQSPSSRGVHVALMGDPTLRMYYGPMAPKITSTENYGNGRVRIRWQPGNDATSGYNVYRASSTDAAWTKLNDAPITATTYLDNNNPARDTVYMIRALGTAVSPAGSYADISQGVITTMPSTISIEAVRLHTASTTLFFDASAHRLSYTSNGAEPVSVRLFDVLGREIKVLESRIENAGRFNFDLITLSRGSYWVTVEGTSTHVTKRIVIE